jgi:hypothetical protein
LSGRVERQAGLQPHQHIKQDKTAGIEQQHGNRIGQPVLFTRLLDPTDAVEDGFDRLQDWREECPLTVEHARDVAAERPGQRDDDRAIEQDLHPTNQGHGTGTSRRDLELLGPQKRPGEVDEEGDGHDASEDVFDKHHGLLETVAPVGIGDR